MKSIPIFRVLRGVVLSALLTGTAAATDFETLSPEDETAYRTIFAAQGAGDWGRADRAVATLQNRVLIGYVMQDRYMHPDLYRAEPAELSRWLNAYGDHPGADRVYAVAKTRPQRGIDYLPPSQRPWRSAVRPLQHPSIEADYRLSPSAARVRELERRLRGLAEEGKAATALNMLADPKNRALLSPRQEDRARGWIAGAYYYEGNLVRAGQLADEAIRGTPDAAPYARWVRGLVAWRQSDFETAFAQFGAQGRNPHQDEALRAAGAYWAARSALRLGEPAEIDRYLAIAANLPFTFYGQLALAQLGQDAQISWHGPNVGPSDWQRVLGRSPHLRRAAALAQLGRMTEAEEELKWAQGSLGAADDAVLLAFALQADLPNAALHIAEQAGPPSDENRHLRAGLYPLPSFAPNTGFRTERAILYGLMRQESKFAPQATSYAGARGLMQLMPRTASAVADDLGLPGADSRLYEPGYNMALGQAYVEELLTRHNDKDGDLFAMALSYNWGPGNFRRWKERTGLGEDPLLMIESVPDGQARHFVETVVKNVWLYRDRLGEPSPSRDQAAAGHGALVPLR